MRSLCGGATSWFASSCWRMEERMREDLSTLSMGLTLSAMTVSMSDLSKRWEAGNTTCREQASMRRLPERESASRRSKALSFSLLCSSSCNVSVSGAASRFFWVRFFHVLSGLSTHARIAPSSSTSSMRLSRATGILVMSSSPSRPPSAASSRFMLLSCVDCCCLPLLPVSAGVGVGVGFGSALPLFIFLVGIFSMLIILSMAGAAAPAAPGAHILRTQGGGAGGGMA
mmetsp:Transcript_10118/g.33721  ORF Transcript_10118/g.33721 Transcript_10118/m.33721 type:complete len:228 (-) Transcript_10118:2079-2762(-)